MDWFPWYFDIYSQDTMHLGPYQDGCYRRLIDHYMKTRAALPDNDTALARIVGDSEANWVAMASLLVRPFFTPKSGRLYLRRCEEILNHQDSKTKILSESGKTGAAKRWNKIKEDYGHPIATPMGPAIAEERRGTEEDKERTPLKPPKISAPEIQMEFEKVWNAYPGIGKDGLVGAAFKGSKKKARQVFEGIIKKTDDIEILMDNMLFGASQYEKYLNQSGYPSKHLTTWLNQACWQDNFETTQNSTKGKSNGQSASNIGRQATELMERIRQGETFENPFSCLPSPESIREGN